jgi:hypothetical protein
MLTFISIRGRQQGESNAANRFGEILVALQVSSLQFKEDCAAGKPNRREEEEAREEEKKQTDSPVKQND